MDYYIETSPGRRRQMILPTDASSLKEFGKREGWGKTHYFDPDTLRFFGSRFGRVITIRRAGGRDEELGYCLPFVVFTESTWNGWDKTGREYRVRVLDVRHMTFTDVQNHLATSREAGKIAETVAKEIQKAGDGWTMAGAMAG